MNIIFKKCKETVKTKRYRIGRSVQNFQFTQSFISHHYTIGAYLTINSYYTLNSNKNGTKK